jgi:ribonucleoside-triphosphate reductase (formate)
MVKIMKTLKIPTEIYSRVVGYFRPVNQWNKGKQEEFRNRKTYDTKKLGENTNENSAEKS